MAAVEFKFPEDAVARWAQVPAKAANAVRYGFFRYITFLIQYVKREKLSGQVLGKYQNAYDLVGGQTRWRKRPGKLKREFTAQSRADLEAEFTAPIYGKAWEEGFSRRRYFVKPTVAKALVWHAGGNSWAFSKGHWIPAQTFAAKPWMRPSILETRPQFLNMAIKPLVNVLLGNDPGGSNPYFRNFGRAA